MDDIIDLLKIKIEKAKRGLSLETVNAIDSVDWRTTILELRSKYGYTFEQLGDLELETELLLCGLVSPEQYPKELEDRMKISKSAANELVNEMNNLIFSRIREELIKNIERKKMSQQNSPIEKEENEVKFSSNSPHPDPLLVKEREDIDTQVLNSAGIEIVPEKLELTTSEKPIESREDILKKIEKPEAVHPILEQKLSASFQIPTVKTEHTLENITKSTNESKPIPQAPKAYQKNADPYRLSPEE